MEWDLWPVAVGASVDCSACPVNEIRVKEAGKNT